MIELIRNSVRNTDDLGAPWRRYSVAPARFSRAPAQRASTVRRLRIVNGALALALVAITGTAVGLWRTSALLHSELAHSQFLLRLVRERPGTTGAAQASAPQTTPGGASATAAAPDDGAATP
jgi:hypothetical protein